MHKDTYKPHHLQLQWQFAKGKMNHTTNWLSCLALQGKTDFWTTNFTGKFHPELLFDSHYLLENSLEHIRMRHHKMEKMQTSLDSKTDRAESLQISQTGTLLKWLKSPTEKPSISHRQMQYSKSTHRRILHLKNYALNKRKSQHNTVNNVLI